jgi:hypothetical protein
MQFHAYDYFCFSFHALFFISSIIEKILFIFRARRCFCAFKGLYCLDLRLGVKDLFMHKKHSLRALNIKITIFYLKIKTRVQILKNNIKNSFYKGIGALVPYGSFSTPGTRAPNQPL